MHWYAAFSQASAVPLSPRSSLASKLSFTMGDNSPAAPIMCLSLSEALRRFCRAVAAVRGGLKTPVMGEREMHAAMSHSNSPVRADTWGVGVERSVRKEGHQR